MVLDGKIQSRYLASVPTWPCSYKDSESSSTKPSSRDISLTNLSLMCAFQNTHIIRNTGFTCKLFTVQVIYFEFPANRFPIVWSQGLEICSPSMQSAVTVFCSGGLRQTNKLVEFTR